MEIIQPGRPKRDDLLTGTCRSCGCRVRCKRSEAQCYAGDQREPDPYYWVKCPTEGCDNGHLYLNEERG